MIATGRKLTIFVKVSFRPLPELTPSRPEAVSRANPEAARGAQGAQRLSTERVRIRAQRPLMPVECPNPSEGVQGELYPLHP